MNLRTSSGLRRRNRPFGTSAETYNDHPEEVSGKAQRQGRSLALISRHDTDGNELSSESSACRSSFAGSCLQRRANRPGCRSVR